MCSNLLKDNQVYHMCHVPDLHDLLLIQRGKIFLLGLHNLVRDSL